MESVSNRAFIHGIGTSIYYKGIEVVGITKSASFTLLVPFFAVLLSFMILGEMPEISTAIGGILAIIAIYLISLYNKKHFRFLGLFLRKFTQKNSRRLKSANERIKQWNLT